MPKDQYLVLLVNTFIFMNLMKFWIYETKLMLARRGEHEPLL